MDDVDIPSERVPEGLKSCEQILKRAKELKKAEPVVSYWCCFSAAEKVLKVHSRTKEQTMFLMSLLDALEKMKAVLAGNDAISSEAAGAMHVENFALKVFMSADNDDRAGITGKATIRKFVVAGQFIEVLRCFENGMTEEVSGWATAMEQKLQYARWKAADGAKALREGRTPTSGPPIPEQEESPFPTLPSASPGTASSALQGMSPPTSTLPPARASPPVFPASGSRDVTPIISPRPSPAASKGAGLPSIDTSSHENLRTPQRTHSSGSGAWSTVATPGVPDDGSEARFDITSSGPPAISPDEQTKSPGERKNVRFMGPDGAPLSPAQTHLTVDSYDAPAAPPPTTFSPSPTEQHPSPLPPARPRGDSVTRPTASPRTNGTPPVQHAIPPSLPVPPPPPPSLASYPSAPPPIAHPSGLGLSNPPLPLPLPSAPPQLAPTPKSLSRRQVDETQKHAKWAISALDFDDYETARNELRKALAILGG
ncbi:hypothetical protein JCM24511_05134 [Saitozyma sp. JCM 24511]|nr:hypothetical protein JCM24511_05134 [Saitozyma sp. JCM 24511]